MKAFLNLRLLLRGIIVARLSWSSLFQYLCHMKHLQRHEEPNVQVCWWLYYLLKVVLYHPLHQVHECLLKCRYQLSLLPETSELI